MHVYRQSRSSLFQTVPYPCVTLFLLEPIPIYFQLDLWELNLQFEWIQYFTFQHYISYAVDYQPFPSSFNVLTNCFHGVTKRPSKFSITRFPRRQQTCNISAQWSTNAVKALRGLHHLKYFINMLHTTDRNYFNMLVVIYGTAGPHFTDMDSFESQHGWAIIQIVKCELNYSSISILQWLPIEV